MAIESSSIPSNALIITDTSIKNNIVMSISHIHIQNNPITKTLHHVVYVTSTEAELFAIRCGINQAMNCNDISKIIVVTNSIHVTRKIFNPLFHLYQVYIAARLSKLHNYFLHHQSNSIEFWECSSCCNWALHKVVDKETKTFNPTPLFPCKMSWNFNKKSKCDDLSNNWKIIFQVSDLKERQFLKLLDSDDNIIELSYIKGEAWLKFFGHLNSLCAKASRAITNHAPIGKYRLIFFPREEFRCSYGLYPIKTR